MKRKPRIRVKTVIYLFIMALIMACGVSLPVMCVQPVDQSSPINADILDPEDIGTLEAITILFRDPICVNSDGVGGCTDVIPENENEDDLLQMGNLLTFKDGLEVDIPFITDWIFGTEPGKPPTLEIHPVGPLTIDKTYNIELEQIHNRIRYTQGPGATMDFDFSFKTRVPDNDKPTLDVISWGGVPISSPTPEMFVGTPFTPNMDIVMIFSEEMNTPFAFYIEPEIEAENVLNIDSTTSDITTFTLKLTGLDIGTNFHFEVFSTYDGVAGIPMAAVLSGEDGFLENIQNALKDLFVDDFEIAEPLDLRYAFPPCMDITGNPLSFYFAGPNTLLPSGFIMRGSTARVRIDEPPRDNFITSSTIGVSGIYVYGHTDPNKEVNIIWVNGITAAMSEGYFSVTLSDLGEGPLTITADATAVGVDVDAGYDRIHVFIDTFPPAIDITNPTDGSCHTTKTIIVTGTVTDHPPSSGIISVMVNGVTASFDGGIFTATFTDLSEGLHTLIAEVTDACGSVHTTMSDPVSFTVDTESPTGLAASKAGNSYCFTPITVVLTASDGTIYYTLDGSGPTTGSMVYTGPINIILDTVLKFMAVDICGNESDIVTEFYSIDTTPPTNLVASPAGGSYCPTMVSLSASDGGKYYTLDGTEPTTGSMFYAGPEDIIDISVDTTLKFMSVDTCGNQADTVTEVYDIDTEAEPPTDLTASPAGGSYCGTTTVSLSASDGTIYYTTDGTEPTTDSTEYSGQININVDAMLQFMAVDTCGNQAATVIEVYDVDPMAVVIITSPMDGIPLVGGDVWVSGIADTDIATVTVTSDQGHSESSEVDTSGNWSVVLMGVTLPSIEINAVGIDYCNNIGSDLVTVPITEPTIWYVDITATGDNTGRSWENAFTVIQDAVDKASSSDWIWVARGTYTNSPASTVSILTMTNGVEIYGGFTGTETDLSDRDPAINETILDGENTSYHVVIGDSNARLDGFIVTRGNASISSNYDGGGMFNDNAIELTVVNCTFSGNSAFQYGGGMYNRQSSLTIFNCSFIGNSVVYEGGGMYNQQSSLTIFNCSFIGNSAVVYEGGGMYNEKSSLTITSCTFSGNQDYGIYLLDSPVINKNIIIDNNTIEHGIYAKYMYSQPTVKNNTFINYNEYFLHLPANSIAGMSGNSFSGTDGGSIIEVLGNQITESGIFRNYGMPYKVVSGTISVYSLAYLDPPAILTIDPGVEIQFNSDTGLKIGQTQSAQDGFGALIAEGTTANPITFTNSGANFWNGINFYTYTLDDQTILDHCVVEYSVGRNLIIQSTSPTIRNSVIRNGNDFGIYILYSSPLIENNEIIDNAKHGIYCHDSSPTIEGNTIKYTPAHTNIPPEDYGIYFNLATTAVIQNNTVDHNIYFSAANTTANPTISGNVFNNYDQYPVQIEADVVDEYFDLNTINNKAAGVPINVLGETITSSARWQDQEDMPYVISVGYVKVYGDALTSVTLTLDPGVEIRFDQNTRLEIGKDGRGALVAVGTTTNTITFTRSGANNWGGIWFYRYTVDEKTILDNCVVEYGGGGTSYGNLYLYSTSPTIRNSIIRNSALDGIYIYDSSPVIENNLITDNADNGIYCDSYYSSSSPIIDNNIIKSNNYGIKVVYFATIPIIHNNIIKSNDYGIYAINYSTPIIYNNDIYSNNYGIYIKSNSEAIIHNNNIYSNATQAVYNDTPIKLIDARLNWWGADTGPAPSGGNSISGKICCDPWLGTEFSYPFKVKEVFISRNPVDGGPTFFYVDHTDSATSTLTITGSSVGGSTVKAFTGISTGAGTSFTQVWEGDSDGPNSLVPDGTYYYHIVSESISGSTAAPAIGTVNVETGAPIALIISPTQGAVLPQGPSGEKISITGVADASTVVGFSYKVEYGEGEFPSSWENTDITNISSDPVVNGVLAKWDTSQRNKFIYTLRLTVTNNGIDSVYKVKVYVLQIYDLSATPDPFSPGESPGIKDTTTITANISYPFDWRVDIGPEMFPEVIRSFTGSGTEVSVVWDGTDSQGAVDDGNYTYTIYPATGGTLAQEAGTVVVDNSPPVATITEPTNGTTIANFVDILGEAVDEFMGAIDVTRPITYSVEFENNNTSGAWYRIGIYDTPVYPSNNLATWETNDNTANILIENGQYNVTLTVTDDAGNSSTATTMMLTLDNILITEVSRVPSSINTCVGNPCTGEDTTVTFSINQPGIVTLKIYPELAGENGMLVYGVSQTCVSIGSHSMTWNGRDNNGEVAPDDAYIYVLEAISTSGIGTDKYNPDILCSGRRGYNIDKNGGYYFNPYKNNFYNIEYNTLTYIPQRLTYRLADLSGPGPTFSYLWLQKPHDKDTYYSVMWDGMDQAGNILKESRSISIYSTRALKINYIITTGSAPEILGMTWLDNPGVKSDPYMVDLCYGQLTRFRYTLHPIDRDADVTITVTGPQSGGTDIPSSFTIFSGTQSGGEHEVCWDAIDPDDPNGAKSFIIDDCGFTTGQLITSGKRFLIDSEGPYVFRIDAVNPYTGASIYRRGVINIRQ